MIKTSLKIAAVVLTFAPGVAAAQSGVADPAVPGSGYQVPQTPRTGTPSLSADPVDLSKPGSGYQVPETPRTGTPSLSADPVDLSKPGSGYQIPTASPTDAAKERPATDRQ